MARNLLWLYRPSVPSARAQAIQSVTTAHAMAARGHHVTLFADRHQGFSGSVSDVLGFYGLSPVPTFRLKLLDGGRTRTSLAFRVGVMAWRTRYGANGVAVARAKRYADQLLGPGPRCPRWILEAHEVDSLQLEERGEDGTAMRALERRLLSRCDGVIANAPGTLELLRQTHGALPPARVLHNATRMPGPRVEGGVGIGYVGSARRYKDLLTLSRVAHRIPWPVHLVGPDPDDAFVREMVESSHGRLRLDGPVAPRDIPRCLQRFRVLVLPLGQGLFGERLTSPLKLWDYMASGIPVVGADLRSLQEAVPGAFVPYRPGDVASLESALRAAYLDEALRARVVEAAPVRTWADRAEEFDLFVDEVLGDRP